MPTTKFKHNRATARPKALTGKGPVAKARFALARAQNVEQGHPSLKNTDRRRMAEEQVLIAINAKKGRKPGKL